MAVAAILNPRPPGLPRASSRAGYHTMLDNGPKRRNRHELPNSIFLSTGWMSGHFFVLKISQFLSLVLISR